MDSGRPRHSYSCDRSSSPHSAPRRRPGMLLTSDCATFDDVELPRAGHRQRHRRHVRDDDGAPPSPSPHRSRRPARRSRRSSLALRVGRRESATTKPASSARRLMWVGGRRSAATTPVRGSAQRGARWGPLRACFATPWGPVGRTAWDKRGKRLSQAVRARAARRDRPRRPGARCCENAPLPDETRTSDQPARRAPHSAPPPQRPARSAAKRRRQAAGRTD